MYYSLTFVDDSPNVFGKWKNQNTYDDWYLVPTTRPHFEPPSFSSKMIEIPGRDGFIDASTALTGYPTYGNRSGSIEFLIYNSPYTWNETYTKVMNYLHGQKRKVFLEDDKAYLYEGRFTVNSFASREHYSTISIDYELQPYKMSRWTTTEEWEWDPFNFSNGVILKDFYKDINVDISDGYAKLFQSGDIEEKYRQEAIGRMTVVPTLHISSDDNSGLDLYFNNLELGIDTFFHADDGSKKYPDVIFSMQHPDNRVYLSAKGKGSVSIEFYIGNL